MVVNPSLPPSSSVSSGRCPHRYPLRLPLRPPLLLLHLAPDIEHVHQLSHGNFVVTLSHVLSLPCRLLLVSFPHLSSFRSPLQLLHRVDPPPRCRPRHSPHAIELAPVQSGFVQGDCVTVCEVLAGDVAIGGAKSGGRIDIYGLEAVKVSVDDRIRDQPRLAFSVLARRSPGSQCSRCAKSSLTTRGGGVRNH
ncbi:hypothetical protein B296_00052431 [Ensete ventricosum]|uniref:Uncharacterized protein n=1 Tax=Ensete ventricosum TaxID=4639 RepID=A0A426XXG6_ENSVE|nr:hypothetical protein B296_00052431 [Ensete ventricosum]